MPASNGKLEKAVIYVNNNGKKSKVAVQFNPTEYKISSFTKLSENRALGGDPDIEETQAVSGTPSALKLLLYFDSYTPMTGVDLAKNQKFKMDRVNALKERVDSNSAANKDDEIDPPDPDQSVNAACDNFISLIRYDPKEHQPPDLAFIWGEYLEFVGKMEACSVKFTMFSRSGIPVRARMTLTIRGEDRSKLQKNKQSPFESPDRTKERVLAHGDQLWMLAEEEYGDPGQWKVIARANGILNPREMRSAMKLKVPSIR